MIRVGPGILVLPFVTACIAGGWSLPEEALRPFGAYCSSADQCQASACTGTSVRICTEPCASSTPCPYGFECAGSGYCEPAPPPMVDAGTDAGPPTLDLSFDPSNVGPLATGRPIGRASTSARTCYFDTSLGYSSCLTGDFFYVDNDPEDEFGVGIASRLAVFVGQELHLPIAERITVRGAFPLVVIVQGDILIDGEMVAGEGFPATPHGGTGEGPGGGGYRGPGLGYGGEGAAHCTAGALGARMERAVALPYGDRTIPRLLPGSGGGGNPNVSGSDGGAGGGSIQLVAGGRIVVSATGSVSANGYGGRGDSSDGGGGGSGGSILLEAPEVVVEGSLSANGGNGGVLLTGDAAEGARMGRVPAEAGRRESSRAQGGGGGFGWIRINTMTATASVSRGTFSPDSTTGCSSVGELQPATTPPSPPSCAAVTNAPNEACAACVATHCCPRAEACARDAVCVHCLTEAGTTCRTNEALGTYRYCASSWCTRECGATFLEAR